MPLSDLLGGPSQSPFTDDDRIMHTRKQVERAFGRPAEDVGQVEMRDGQAVLVVDYGGKQHLLRWERSPYGSIVWFADDSTEPIALATPERAADILARSLR